MNNVAMENNVSRETRLLLWLVIIADASYGILLYLFPGRAADYWAWEMGQPRTAMLIGSIYLIATLHYFLLTRLREWLLIRSTLISLFLVAAWLLVVAMVHWDTFYPYRFYTLNWLAAYYFTLFIVPIVFRIQRERARPAALAGPYLSRGWQSWLLARGALYTIAAIVIFAFAGRLATLWPWPIEPVNLRMLSGLVFVFGALSAYVKGDGLWPRIKYLLLLSGLLGLTALFGLLILRTPYDWSSPIGLLLPLVFVEWLATTGVLWRTYR